MVFCTNAFSQIKYLGQLGGHERDLAELAVASVEGDHRPHGVATRLLRQRDDGLAD